MLFSVLWSVSKALYFSFLFFFLFCFLINCKRIDIHFLIPLLFPLPNEEKVTNKRLCTKLSPFNTSTGKVNKTQTENRRPLEFFTSNTEWNQLSDCFKYLSKSGNAVKNEIAKFSYTDMIIVTFFFFLMWMFNPNEVLTAMVRCSFTWNLPSSTLNTCIKFCNLQTIHWGRFWSDRNLPYKEALWLQDPSIKPGAGTWGQEHRGREESRYKCLLTQQLIRSGVTHSQWWLHGRSVQPVVKGDDPITPLPFASPGWFLQSLPSC